MQSFARSFIAKTHEMNYAELENVTELPLGASRLLHRL